ncbi:glycoside hydrolase family 6 protein [Streptomyces sp. NPDC003832]
MSRLRRLLIPVACAALAAGALGGGGEATAAPNASAPDHTLPRNTRFYVDPEAGAAQQAAADLKAGKVDDALRMAQLATWPQAIWLDYGTPAEIEEVVRKKMRAARATGTVPVFVLYNVTGRDCSFYSSGGADSPEEYRAWVQGVADGIGAARAVVIVEPDGLALLPKDCPEGDADGTRTDERYANIRTAVDIVVSKPKTSVYLDGGSSNWQPVGELAGRLIKADLAKTQGFALNVSNYQPTDQLNRYATWVSKCVWPANWWLPNWLDRILPRSPAPTHDTQPTDTAPAPTTG